MDEWKYENAPQLRDLFSRFAKSDWRKLTRWSIKASEVRLLLAIKESHGSCSDAGGMTVSDLSKLLQVTSPTVTQMINNLIKNDYVIRSIHPGDRRVAEITLTDKGEQIAQEAGELFTQLFNGLIDHLGKEQSDQLIALLEQVFQYFEQVGKEQL
ncbi:DNA-binding transcriptional regulator, MarR family [Paenibacillus sp. UNCCL117]|uniref:MarR family winged helix-turn-helix transcriptional regulator n=1 Tax=unclassified Paenibacillus TaxID=185978 RepID=UPI0008909223|nr:MULTISPECIES: MarR family winged helix-turn-helix transcriptional regulator [unclassified Paenibacillus]SDD08296.1 DNA-binding transcriptional regulator, MarR family [Paenibacillus sp. cl123]SFW31244.1 DNA-binding transcriptional regulator, MarR family [Paenibacillus sp. UNCCL117]